MVETPRRAMTAARRLSDSGRVGVAFMTILLLLALLFVGQVQARPAPDSFADLADRLLPAVVNISTTQKAPERRGEGLPIPQFPPGSPFEEFFKEFFDRQQRGNRPARPVTSLGSGFIIDPSGIVVTNNHVIDGADEVKVILHDDSELPAKVIASDPKTDIAVLRVEPKKPLTAVKWGDSNRARVGDWVLAIGNPLGLGGTVTAGIISARGRDIRSGPYDDFLQTDASINKGNSGGPLFNMDGEVIGVNTAIFSQTGGSIGIGFAVPSALARPVVQQLVEFGRTKRGWLGVRIQSVTEEIAESLGLDRPRGALIAGVSEGGPAEKGKIEAGDVVLSFDGKPVADMRQLPRIVAETPIGKEVPVDLWRRGKPVKTKVVVGELKEEVEQASLQTGRSSGGMPNTTSLDQLGFSLSSITPEVRQRYDLKGDVKGVVVTDVKADGIAASKDIRAGDIIVEVAQSEVETPEQVVAKVKEVADQKRRSVLLLVQRGNDVRFVALPLKS
ncbi:MAG: DegQ family serine endoprotease [Alphaproteobacteria bacterium]|nr:DegQ family serine endoprotease [Alphaproteobacteria bacterium]